tara:strand:- start:165 stop:692 length:528 start_codon:yes stop_codon:yes gene_type:complete
MSTGYELMVRAEQLVLDLLEREGETSDLIDAAIAELSEDTSQKMDGYRFYIQAFTGKAERLRDQARRMSALAQQCEREAKGIKLRAMEVMQARCELHGWDEGRRIDCENGIVYLTQRTKVSIPDEEAFIKANEDQPWVQTVKKINRSAVGKAILNKDPIPVEGAEVEEYTTITFK